MRICSRAVEIDPYYAQAWALLAIAQSNLRYGFGQEVDDGFAAAHTALAIDPTVAEAHCAKARRLEARGHDDEAFAELQKGLTVNPESWELNKAIANYFMQHRKIAEAASHFAKAAEVMDSDYHAWGLLMTCYHGLGEPEQAQHAAKMALQQVEKVLTQDPSNGAAISFGVTALASLGDRQRAEEWMQRALLVDPDNLNMRYNFACALARYLGDGEAAITMLETTLSRTRGYLGNVEADPDLDSIRDHPRFKKALADAKRRLGLDQPTASAAQP